MFTVYFSKIKMLIYIIIFFVFVPHDVLWLKAIYFGSLSVDFQNSFRQFSEHLNAGLVIERCAF